MNDTNQLTFGGVSYDLEDHRISTIVDTFYPVGSIYMNVSLVDPAALFGGTWQRIEDTFLLSAGQTYTAGDTGGEAEHTLAKEELPTEHMTFRRLYNAADGSTVDVMAASQTDGSIGVADGTNGRPDINFHAATISGITTGQKAMQYTYGGGQSHNNMPPYLAVYMWKRTQ
jgi:hypothetical protein